MKRLYFVRHGESYINIRDVFATKVGGPNDLGLTENGKEHARKGAVVARENKLKIDRIICSPALRARETADIIARAIDFPLAKIEYDARFIELQFGALEGTSWNAFWEAGKTYRNLDQIQGAETIEMLQRRAELALAYLKTLPEDNILVVSHSAFGRALRRAVHQESYALEFQNKSPLPHGEILEFI